jgi:polygalacturonase
VRSLLHHVGRSPTAPRRSPGALAGALVVSALIAGTGLVAVPLALTATTTCQVAYSVTASWPGGFTASVTITNGGSAVSAWTLGFTFPGNQQVTQGWAGTWSQSGESVTVTSASWNGSLAAGGATTIGFNGSYSGSNPSPTAFTLNGAACGGASGSPSPSATTATPTPTASPSSSPTPTPTPTQSTPGVTLATGDSRSVSQPSVPAACTTLSAQLATSNEQFSSGAEASPPDTSRIQSALNSCSGSGRAVVLAPSGGSNAFLSGPLTLPASVTLLIEDGATLYASRNPASYQVSGQAACGTTASSGNGCQPFITVTGSNAQIMGTQGSGGGQGAINGRGDQDILGTSGTWWDLSQTAKTQGNKQNNPRLIEAHGVNNLVVYDVDLVNAPIFHLYFEGGNGLTVWGVRIKTPATARNTDGVDPDSATNVTINDSYIQDGDDGVAIKTNSGPASNMTVENSHFYGTHGISVGSETQHGVSNILVRNNTVSGVDSSGNVSTDDNGIRIKTDSSVGGTVNQVTYENTCLTGIKHAMEFNPFYASGNGSTTPYYTNIVVNGLKSVSSQSSAQSVLDGYDSSHLLGLTLENVSLDAASTSAEYARIGSFNANLSPSGTDVTVTAISGSGSVPSCAFPGYPGL